MTRSRCPGAALALALLAAAAAPSGGQQSGPTWLWAQELISPFSQLGGASHAVTDLAAGLQGSALVVGTVYELCYSRYYADCYAGNANEPSTSTDFGWQPGQSNLSNAAFMTKVRLARDSGRGQRGAGCAHVAAAWAASCWQT